MSLRIFSHDIKFGSSTFFSSFSFSIGCIFPNFSRISVFIFSDTSFFVFCISSLVSFSFTLSQKLKRSLIPFPAHVTKPRSPSRILKSTQRTGMLFMFSQVLNHSDRSFAFSTTFLFVIFTESRPFLNFLFDFIPVIASIAFSKSVSALFQLSLSSMVHLSSISLDLSIS